MLLALSLVHRRRASQTRTLAKKLRAQGRNKQAENLERTALRLEAQAEQQAARRQSQPSLNQYPSDNADRHDKQRDPSPPTHVRMSITDFNGEELCAVGEVGSYSIQWYASLHLVQALYQNVEKWDRNQHEKLLALMDDPKSSKSLRCEPIRASLLPCFCDEFRPVNCICQTRIYEHHGRVTDDEPGMGPKCFVRAWKVHKAKWMQTYSSKVGHISWQLEKRFTCSFALPCVWCVF